MAILSVELWENGGICHLGTSLLCPMDLELQQLFLRTQIHIWDSQAFQGKAHLHKQLGSPSVLLPRAFVSVTGCPLMTCSLLLSNHSFCLVLTPSQENRTFGKLRDCFADSHSKAPMNSPSPFFSFLPSLRKVIETFLN